MKKIVDYRIIEPAPLAVRLWASFALALLAAFLLVLPAAAQDVTTEPAPTEEATLAATVAPTEVPTAEPTATPVPVQPLFNSATAAELLLFLGLSALAGGGVVAIVLTFLGRKDVRDRVEDARESWSEDQKKMLADFTTLFERSTVSILDFLKAVQDGKPNDAGS